MAAKRQKTGEQDIGVYDIDDIFYLFLKREKAVKDLEFSSSVLEQGFNGCSFVFYKLISTDAGVSKTFSKAYVETETYSDRNTFPIGDIFVDGVDILKKYLDKRLPKDENMLKALSKLLQFFCSLKDHQILMAERKTATEAQWAITVAQHLLVKLAVHDTYIIDSTLGVTSRTKLCPCKELDEMIGEIGDTSYGCAEGWHGSVDILLDEAVPVTFTRGDQAEDIEDRSVEIKENFIEYEKAMMIAETIVFSFLQKHKGNLKESFTPGIAISSESLTVYFYDSENDLLIGSLPIDLFANGEIMPQAVVFLWLTLNYKLFCSGSTESMKTYKAAFFDTLGERISMYRDKERLTKPCIAKHQFQTESTPNPYIRSEPFDDKRKPDIAYFKMPPK